MLKRGLEDMNGFLLRVLGDLVYDVRRDREGNIWYRFRHNPSQDLKDSMRQYLRAYNQEHKVSVSVAFPKKFRLRLRERSRSQRRSARPKAKDQEPTPDRRR